MKVLLLAGTAEARALAARLDRDGRIDLTVSLAGATRQPLPLDGTLRVGGFGGHQQQKEFIKDNAIDVVLDVTHPFARRIAARTEMICTALGVPRLKLLRPGWAETPGDRWTRVPDETRIAAALAGKTRVFLGTGPGSLAAIGPVPGVEMLCRRIDPPENPFPFAGGRWLVGRPPFSVEDEVALFERERIDCVVTKDAGGHGGRAKIDAARELGLPVVMVDRPSPPPGPVVETIDAALDWIEAL